MRFDVDCGVVAEEEVDVLDGVGSLWVASEADVYEVEGSEGCCLGSDDECEAGLAGDVEGS